MYTTVPLSIHQTQVSVVIVETEVCVRCKNKCVTPNIVYQADNTNNADDERRDYLGLSETTFKDRFRNHVRDFNNDFPNMCGI